jgi:hypothetical protein
MCSKGEQARISSPSSAKEEVTVLPGDGEMLHVKELQCPLSSPPALQCWDKLNESPWGTFSNGQRGNLI